MGRGGQALQVPALGVLANQHQQAQMGQLRQQLLAPGGGAFAARRQVAALRVLARKAKAHGQDGDAAGVVKFGLNMSRV